MSVLWAGQVVAINGSTTGPFQPGPSSSFRYDVLCTRTGGKSTTIRGVQPQEQRWDDSIDMWPLVIKGTVVVYEIGGKLYLKDAEKVPYFRPCGAQR